MDAPIYPPASAFELPLVTAQPVRLDNFSLAELMQMPEAWAIVTKHVPSVRQLVSVPMIQPYLGHLTLHALQSLFKISTPEALAAAAADLSRLPPVKELLP